MSHESADAARRAGVELTYLDRLIELGVLSADAGRRVLRRRRPSAGARARCSSGRGCRSRGSPRPSATASCRLTSWTRRATTDSAPSPTTTFAQLSDADRHPVRAAVVIREAVGFAEPAPGRRRCATSSFRLRRWSQLRSREGFRPAVIERWLRVYGESMRRIAETEADWWRSEVEQRLMASRHEPERDDGACRRPYRAAHGAVPRGRDPRPLPRARRSTTGRRASSTASRPRWPRPASLHGPSTRPASASST